jgi:hypothetical protein
MSWPVRILKDIPLKARLKKSVCKYAVFFFYDLRYIRKCSITQTSFPAEMFAFLKDSAAPTAVLKASLWCRKPLNTLCRMVY